MSLVKCNFTLSSSSKLDCWIVRSVDENGNEHFWFKGHTIASFLGYSQPDQAIRNHVKPKWKRTRDQLRTPLDLRGLEIPAYWKPHTIFISEPGLYALITHSKMPEAEKFTDWIYEEVLPTLRRDGQFKVEIGKRDGEINKLADGLLQTNRALIVANEELINSRRDAEQARQDSERARQDAVVLSHRLADIAQDVIAKPKSDQLLHVLAVHELDEATREIAFTRCQRRSLTNALKRLTEKNPRAKELYRNGYVPNGVNILNCVKDWLKEANVPYSARNNIIKILNNLNSQQVISFVRNIIVSPIDVARS